MNNIVPLTCEIIFQSARVLDVISAIQKSAFKLALIVDENKRLIGTATDGDVRRSILKGVGLDASASMVINPDPVVVFNGKLNVGGAALSGIKFAPVLDDLRIPIGMCVLGDYRDSVPNPVLLLAGGRGTRLMPYTRDLPKPMVEFAGKPMIDHVIGHFKGQGFEKFFISVNHMADQIERHLAVGANLGVDIEFLRESEPLGTAGPLGLLSGKLDQTLLVSNADIVTKCDFRAMLEFHKSLNSKFTVGLREYAVQVPFGVAELDGTNLTSIVEKPLLRNQVSAGIYCIEPEVIEGIFLNQYLDMPTLIAQVITTQPARVHGFPIHETWRDVGRPEDLEYMRIQGRNHFE